MLGEFVFFITWLFRTKVQRCQGMHGIAQSFHTGARRQFSPLTLPSCTYIQRTDLLFKIAVSQGPCQGFPKYAILESNRPPTSVSSHSFHNWSYLTTTPITSITQTALNFNMRYLKTFMTYFFDQHCLLSAILFSPEISCLF